MFKEQSLSRGKPGLASFHQNFCLHLFITHTSSKETKTFAIFSLKIFDQMLLESSRLLSSVTFDTIL